MSALNGRWMDHPDGREAIARHLMRLSGWAERERFDIAIDESGGRGRLTISAIGEQGKVDPVSRLSAMLELTGVNIGGSGDPIALTPVPGRAGSLSGSFDLPARGAAAGDRVVRGHLQLTEPGHAVQRIPVVLPVVDTAGRSGAMTEAFTGGQDRAALQDTASRTGGQIVSQTAAGLVLTRPPPPPAPDPQPRHALPLALAAVFAVIAFLSRGSRL
jgi:hypothetical protein